MADQKSLGFIGFAFTGITCAVMLIGCVVVKGHVDGRLSLDGAPRPVVSASLVKHIR
jgi:hypothetical protein